MSSSNYDDDDDAGNEELLYALKLESIFCSGTVVVISMNIINDMIKDEESIEFYIPIHHIEFPLPLCCSSMVYKVLEHSI